MNTFGRLHIKKNTPKFPGYTTLRQDRTHGSRGSLITLVRKFIPSTNTSIKFIVALPTDSTNSLELQSTTIRLHKQDIKLSSHRRRLNILTSPDPKTAASHLQHYIYILLVEPIAEQEDSSPLDPAPPL